MELEMNEVAHKTESASMNQLNADTGKNTYNILYVDDEVNNLNSFRAALRRYYNV